MRHVHKSCLMEWLQHAHGASLSSEIECRVCKAPFALRVPGLLPYLVQSCRALLSGRAGIRSFAAAGLEHLLSDHRCEHIHCAWIRLALVACLLQLCIWEGQLLMLVSFALVRMVMRFDAVLDELVIPSTMLKTFYILMPPLCEVAPALEDMIAPLVQLDLPTISARMLRACRFIRDELLAVFSAAVYLPRASDLLWPLEESSVDAIPRVVRTVLNAEARRCKDMESSFFQQRGTAFRWLPLYPLQADTLLIALLAFHCNTLLASALRPRAPLLSWAKLAKLLQPDLPQSFEEVATSLVSLGLACYFGRVLLAQHQILGATAYPIDFVKLTGLLVNVAVGGAVLVLCSLAQTLAGRLRDDFERWRWRMAEAV
ncbi:hypothetical protein AB1Y20_016316 [Prymnesium parvum]|uniref:RING-CH-type domain-containing protein n=1 Tax=Prymnesium parvum TaxID=97485 RepID=A0AB34ICF4_PRYPA